MSFMHDALDLKLATEKDQKRRDYRMRFGKYKGEKLDDIPASYLLWIYDEVENLDDILKGYIRDNYLRLEKEKHEMSEDWNGEGYGAEWWKD